MDIVFKEHTWPDTSSKSCDDSYFLSIDLPHLHEIVCHWGTLRNMYVKIHSNFSMHDIINMCRIVGNLSKDVNLAIWRIFPGNTNFLYKFANIDTIYRNIHVRVP